MIWYLLFTEDTSLLFQSHKALMAKACSPSVIILDTEAVTRFLLELFYT